MIYARELVWSQKSRFLQRPSDLLVEAAQCFKGGTVTSLPPDEVCKTTTPEIPTRYIPIANDDAFVTVGPFFGLASFPIQGRFEGESQLIRGLGRMKHALVHLSDSQASGS